jgi:hypothetical protein
VLSTPAGSLITLHSSLLMAAICKAFCHRCHSSCSSRLLPLPSPSHLTKQQHACRVLAAFQGRRPADGEQCDCLKKFAQLLGCARVEAGVCAARDMCDLAKGPLDVRRAPFLKYEGWRLRLA